MSTSPTNSTIDAILNKGKVINTSGTRSFLVKEIKEKVIPHLKRNGIKEVPAKDVRDVLNLYGHDYKGANAIGDALGGHSDGLNLPSRLIGGVKHYNFSSLF